MTRKKKGSEPASRRLSITERKGVEIRRKRGQILRLWGSGKLYKAEKSNVFCVFRGANRRKTKFKRR